MSALIGDVYAAVTEPERWPAVLAGISAQHRGAGILLHRQNLPSGVEDVLVHGLPQAACDSFAAGFGGAEQLEVTRSMGELAVARPFTPEQFLGGERAFLEHPVFAAVLRPHGLRYLACSVIYFETHWGVAFSMARPEAAGPYEAAELGRLGDTLQHLSRAMALRYALAASERTRLVLAELLDAFDRAALVIDRHCDIRFANRLAVQLLDRADGLGARSGRLELRRSEELKRLTGLIEGCTAPGLSGTASAGGMMLISRDGGRPLHAVISPLLASLGHDVEPGLAMVLIADPDQPPPDPRLLASAHGLTQAEAAVAARLMIGESRAEAAQTLGISINTVRFHLRNLLAKTGTRRQSELLLLLRSTG